jgi:hypothetical protein
MITAAAVVAGIFLAAPMATADDVQEQLRLMEQRMAEMEDRLQATSDELATAKETVNEQQTLLSGAGLAADDRGIRSGVGNFLKEVDVSGVVAASYNHRFLDSQDDNQIGGNVGFFRHPDSNTIALDQIWLTVTKPSTEESRGGINFDYVFGKTAQAQGQNIGGTTANDYESSGLLYTGYVSYLAPIGSGVEFAGGKLATPLGAETIKTNDNFNITTGRVFGLQPVNHVGLQAATAITDNVGLTVGVVNDLYTDNNFDNEFGKTGYAQLSIGGDMFGLNIGAIVGENSGLGCADADDDCFTSVFDVVLSADLADNVSVWANFDWVRNFGSQQVEGDAYGVSAAGRVGITDSTGFATRVEYVRGENSFNRTAAAFGNISEVVTLTGTIDHALTDDVKLRLEARWDTSLDNTDGVFVNSQNGPTNGGVNGPFSPNRDDQVVGLAELYYEF